MAAAAGDPTVFRRAAALLRALLLSASAQPPPHQLLTPASPIAKIRPLFLCCPAAVAPVLVRRRPCSSPSAIDSFHLRGPTCACIIGIHPSTRPPPQAVTLVAGPQGTERPTVICSVNMLSLVQLPFALTAHVKLSSSAEVLAPARRRRARAALGLLEAAVVAANAHLTARSHHSSSVRPPALTASPFILTSQDVRCTPAFPGNSQHSSTAAGRWMRCPGAFSLGPLWRHSGSGKYVAHLVCLFGKEPRAHQPVRSFVCTAQSALHFLQHC